MIGIGLASRDNMTAYSYRTDAIHTDPSYPSADAALASAIAGGDWAEIGSARETRDINDAAWLTICVGDGVSVYRRGRMP